MAVGMDQKKIKQILGQINQAYRLLETYDYSAHAIYDDGEPYLEDQLVDRGEKLSIIFSVYALKRLSDCFQHSPDTIMSSALNKGEVKHTNFSEFEKNVEAVPEFHAMYKALKDKKISGQTAVNFLVDWKLAKNRKGEGAELTLQQKVAFKQLFKFISFEKNSWDNLVHERKKDHLDYNLFVLASDSLELFCKSLGFEDIHTDLSYLHSPQEYHEPTVQRRIAIEKEFVDKISKIELSPEKLSPFEVDEITSQLIKKYGFSKKLPSVSLEDTAERHRKNSKDLSRLIVSLLQPKHHERIFDPCCGVGENLAEAALQASKTKSKKKISANERNNTLDINIGACEVSSRGFFLAQMRLLLMGCPVVKKINQGNFIQKQQNRMLLEEPGQENLFTSDVNYQKKTKELEASKDIYPKDKSLDVIICDPEPADLKSIDQQLFKLLKKDKDKEIYRGGGVGREQGPTYSIGSKRVFLPVQSLDSHFILTCMRLLNDRGRMGIIVDSSFLSGRGPEKKIRKYLVEEDYLDAIFSLGGKSATSAILILKQKKASDRVHKIFFKNIDMTFSKEGFEEISNESINRALLEYAERSKPSSSFQHNSEKKYNADLEEVRESDYNLDPFEYFDGMVRETKLLLQSDQGKYLNEISDVLIGSGKPKFWGVAFIESENSLGQGIPFVTKEHLLDDDVYPHLHLGDDESLLFEPEATHRRISRKCILASLEGKTYARVFDPKILFDDAFVGAGNQPKEVCIEKKMVSIEIKPQYENTIDIEFLCHQINSSQVAIQISRYKDANSDSIAVAKFRKIVVPIPKDFEAQTILAKASMQARLEKEALLSRAETAEIKIKREKEKSKQSREEAEFQIIKHLGHNLNSKIGRVKSTFEVLEKRLKEQGIADNLMQEALEGEKVTLTIEDAIGNSLKVLNQMTNLIKDTRKLILEEIKPEEFEELNLWELFEKEIIPQNQNRNFSINVAADPENENYVINIHKTSFVEAMNNLIRNAEVHAFQGGKGEIVFFLRESGEDSLLIECVNDGEPMPKELTVENFTGFGLKGDKSKGQGLGGAYVYKMVKAHNGGLRIDHGPEWSASFEIILPRRKSNV
jgi:type I restriction-modification system DNA methylase subunit/signal transduction histidine kinase